MLVLQLSQASFLVLRHQVLLHILGHRTVLEILHGKLALALAAWKAAAEEQNGVAWVKGVRNKATVKPPPL